MLFFGNLFIQTKPQSLREIQRKKAFNQTMLDYYTNKIAYLSKKGHHLHLLKMVCRDTPFRLKKDMSAYDIKIFIKGCIRHYKNKLRDAERELKKLNTVCIR